MKKLMYTGVIALGLGLMSFSSQTVELRKETRPNECDEHASQISAIVASIPNTTDDDVIDYYIASYTDCMEN